MRGLDVRLEDYLTKPLNLTSVSQVSHCQSLVTKYVSPKFIANCASLSIKIMCIKNTIPGLIIRWVSSEDHRGDVHPISTFIFKIQS